MPKVAVYLRTSSAIQAEANGSQAQRHALTLWLRGQGLEPETDAVWFADEGYSGASTNRPAWDQLQERTRAGEFDTIACYSLSRAGRSTIDLLGFVKDMDARGVRLVFLKDNVDISTPAGRMFLTILAAMAEYEREMILDRVRSGVRAKTAKGAKPFGPLNRTGWGGARVVDPGRKGCAKIAQDQWDAIYARVEAGATVPELAAELGVRKNYLYRRLAQMRRGA
jgi:DNA invertase Pin-like site-specific DNA recombinase